MMVYSNIANISNKILPYCLGLLALTIPVYYSYLPLALIVCVLLWLLSGNWLNFKSFFNVPKPIILISVYWLLCLISILYSYNISRAFADVTQKLSMILIPLVMITSWEKIKSSSRLIINFFLLGLILLGIFLVSRALYFSVIDTPYGYIFHPKPLDFPWENFFYYFRFTQPNHPTYLAMYYSLGIVFLGSKLREVKSNNVRLFYYFIAIFFIVIIYLSSSKAGIFTGLFVSVVCLFWVLKKRGRIVATFAMLVLSVLFIIILSRNNRISDFIGFYTTEIQNVTGFENDVLVKKLKNEGTVRLSIWSSIPETIGNRWMFGVGVGDTQQELQKGYHRNGIDYAYSLQLNAHNQFLESFIGLGLLGVILLCIILAISFIQALYQKRMVLFLFLSIISFNFMFESVFERLFGVIFFVFFIVFLIIEKD